MTKERYVGLGVFVLGGLLLFATGLFLIGDRRMLFDDSFEVWTEFATITGLQNGATVRVSGKDAGEVKEIYVPSDPTKKFRIKLRIVEELHPLVRTDSVASIQTDGLVGNKFLSVSAGTTQAPEAPPQSTILGREPFEFADLLQQASDTVKEVNKTIVEVRDEIGKTLVVATATAEDARGIIHDAGENIKGITSSSNRIARNLNEIISNVKEGQGSFGRLITDDSLYESAEALAKDAEKTARNIQEASEQARGIITEFREQTSKGLNAQASGTLQNLNEVLSDMAENTEALKRNWFFKGFFKKRGYYDLDNMTMADYRNQLQANRYEKRYWLSAKEVFEKSGNNEILSSVGQESIRDRIRDLLEYREGGIYIVEGYASEGDASDQYIISRRRASLVRTFLLSEFPIPSEALGIMPIGLKVNQLTAETWSGVSLVVFYESKDKK